jgi:hypothetical protein
VNSGNRGLDLMKSFLAGWSALEPLALVPPPSAEIWERVSEAVGKPAASCSRRVHAVVKKFPEPRRLIQIAKAQAALPALKRVPLPENILSNR